MTQPDARFALLARLDEAWEPLEGAVAHLEPGSHSEARDAAGWTAKDHLMHVAAWEQAFLATLDGRPRHEALGVDAAVLRDGDDDTVNAAIFARHRNRPLAEVLAQARSAHTALRARIAGLQDDPALARVPGNTWEHYQEHLAYIRVLLGRRG